MNFVIKVLVTAVNAFLLAYLLPHIEIDNFSTALIVAFVLALLDAIVKPILIFLTLPATLITLGLFLFVINAVIILIDAHFVHGFKVDGFWWALLFSILLSLVNSFVHRSILRDDKNKARS